MVTPNSTATGDVELRGASTDGTGGLIQQAVEKASHLVASEIQLAKQEIGESLRAAVTALIGGVIAAFGLVAFLVMAIVTVVTAVSLHWVAALGFAVVFLVIAVGGGLVAIRRLKRISPLRQTVQSLKEDVEWAKQQLTPDTK
jgi:uncharacterized membrane protein YqjE